MYRIKLNVLPPLNKKNYVTNNYLFGRTKRMRHIYMYIRYSSFYGLLSSVFVIFNYITVKTWKFHRTNYPGPGSDLNMYIICYSFNLYFKLLFWIFFYQRCIIFSFNSITIKLGDLQAIRSGYLQIIKETRLYDLYLIQIHLDS